ncbi:hypothetical protein Nepgr_019235 [Nepenthes gracilis]|uniref:Uncharacterized protein n=1 Tax=Nepenthes gracilis TaxID=150966 RepID=A0AAD3SV17_NEPGR|nr:hypothetical protein Nepgr_019235 [Nepenthes gracilis]
MEVLEIAGSNPSSSIDNKVVSGRRKKDEVLVRRHALNAMLEKCRRELELISSTGDGDEDGDDDKEDDNDEKGPSYPCRDRETDELCDLVKSRFECPDFLEKIETSQVSVQQVPAEGSAWDMVSVNDLWECGSIGMDQDEYVLVRQEDIVEGIACFMAAYLLSLKHTKDLSPKQLQEALSKTFSVKKKKGKLRKAWDGCNVIYNVASWSATAIGIYQNPALLRAASTAFWTSCRVISKLF